MSKSSKFRTDFLLSRRIFGATENPSVKEPSVKVPCVAKTAALLLVFLDPQISQLAKIVLGKCTIRFFID